MVDVGRGFVSLLGAGPGDPELITARALRRLGEADVILYDALVHADLLLHARAGAELVFVGKRAGRASERQTAINERLISEALAGKHVVRLKGGDPYLFGRGSEEAEALARQGIRFEVVPGVPSPMAASAYTGISLTHRNLASSVAYVTATESPDKDKSAHDWPKLATATQTIVFFMGLRHLDALMTLLMDNGRDPHCPAAVVASASLPAQRTVVGTVATIAKVAAEAALSMPALTIVGSVVGLHDHLRWFDVLPLFGKRVLVTRPEGQSDKMARALRDAGADPIEAPTVRVVPPRDPALFTHHVENLGEYDWVIFTSVNGVQALFSELRRQGRDSRALGRAKIAAIGPATAAALELHGIVPDEVPDEYRGEAVAEVLLRNEGQVAGKRIFLPRAEVAREALPDALRARGAHIDVVPAYRTEPARPEDFARIRQRLVERTIDIVTFTSSSTVTRLVEGLGSEANDLLGRVQLAAIGPITADTLAALRLPAQVIATEYTATGLVAALVAHFATRRE
jgi:uroporphyrinogen III methyltransferase/synthase